MFFFCFCFWSFVHWVPITYLCLLLRVTRDKPYVVVSNIVTCIYLSFWLHLSRCASNCSLSNLNRHSGRCWWFGFRYWINSNNSMMIWFEQCVQPLIDTAFFNGYNDTWRTHAVQFDETWCWACCAVLSLHNQPTVQQYFPLTANLCSHLHMHLRPTKHHLCNHLHMHQRGGARAYTTYTTRTRYHDLILNSRGKSQTRSIARSR